jgi:hypothetical protein
MKEIICRVNSIRLFKTQNPGKVDIAGSIELFRSKLKAAIISECPDANIFVEIVQEHSQTTIDGLISHPAISHINLIVEKVTVQNYEWIVIKTNSGYTKYWFSKN